MSVLASETVVVKPELIRLVRRDDIKKWQVHYKLENLKTWFRNSTDTANVKKASKIAERMWVKATFDLEEGRPVTSRKFKPVAEIVLHRLEAEIAAGTAKPSSWDYVSAIKLYFIPFYGLYNVDGIKPAVISEFHMWRSYKVGSELSGSAQNNHNAALNLIFDEAIERGYLTAYERPLTKITGVESDRRAEFSHEELEAMMKYAAKFIDDGRTDRTKKSSVNCWPSIYPSWLLLECARVPKQNFWNGVTLMWKYAMGSPPAFPSTARQTRRTQLCSPQRKLLSINSRFCGGLFRASLSMH